MLSVEQLNKNIMKTAQVILDALAQERVEIPEFEADPNKKPLLNTKLIKLREATEFHSLGFDERDLTCATAVTLAKSYLDAL